MWPYIRRMAKKPSGFGLVMLVVVLVVVMFLVARQWRSVAPTALQVSDPDYSAIADDHGETGAGEALRSGRLPDLKDMRQQTGAHADQLQEALEATE
jgi:hypothetical protein